MDQQATFTKWHKKRKQRGLKVFDLKSVPKALLEEEIAELRTNAELDIVLVDCPGNTEDVSAAAVRLSDVVLSPVKPTSVDLEHSGDTSKFIREMRRSYPNILFLLFLNEVMPRRRILKEMPDSLRSIMAKMDKTFLLNVQIGNTAPVAEFFGSGLSVMEYAPRSAAAIAYKKLTKEIVECLARNSA